MAIDAIPVSISANAGTQNPSANPPREVAVIAIHGVGRHAPGASAEALATLLESVGRSDTADGVTPDTARLDPATKRKFSGFHEIALEVPLAAVPVIPLNVLPKPSWLARVWGVFDERRGFLELNRRASAGGPDAHQLKAEEQSHVQDFDYQYMHIQLAKYHGEPDRSFSTFRFDSRDSLNGDSASPQVHIYDAHYSDLSKPESSFVGFFFAFYQLLFHLAAMGLQSVYWAEKENSVAGSRGWPWRIFSSLHATAVRMLIMFIPLIHLVMLAVGLTAFADKLSPCVSLAVGFIFAGLLGLTAIFLLRRYARAPRRPFLWALIPLAGIAAGIAISWLLVLLGHHYTGLPCEKLLAVYDWLLLAGGAVFWVAFKFAEMRPGAQWVGGILYVLNAGIYIAWFLPHAAAAPGNEGATAALLAIQLAFGEMALFWVICLCSELISLPLSWLCLALADDTKKRCRARSAHRTGRFAFAISASLFLVATLAIWTGIASYTTKKFSVFDNVPHGLVQKQSLAQGPLRYFIPTVSSLEARVRELHGPRPELPPACTKKGGCPGADVAAADFRHPWDDYLDGLLLTSITPGLPLMLVLIAVVFMMILWAFLPSILFEIWAEQTPPSNKSRTRALGEWLSRGLDNTAILIRILWTAVVPVPIVFGALHWMACNCQTPLALEPLFEPFSKWALLIIQGAGAVLAVSVTAIVASILKYGGVVLDTLLDVDNYLRTVPVDETPRARIAERIASLLRYVAEHRDSQGRPYERLVIVAHSLGTLVISDLLRFLKNSDASQLSATQKADSQSATPEPLPGSEKKPLPKDNPLCLQGLQAGPPTTPIPIYLFSMGSPLRPLLNRFFPHLYEWVSAEPDNSSRSSELGSAREQHQEKIPPDALPQTADLCIRGWCNAYRSGDYVGRYLWNPEWLTRNTRNDGAGLIDRIHDAAIPPTRTEMCIGIGAHTHYWDREALDVRDALEELIANPATVFTPDAAASSKT